MRIEKYTSEHYPALAAAARKVHVDSLLCREFVDFYYLGQTWSELYLGLDENSECIAFLGIDRMRLEQNGEPLDIGMATNFYTLKPGVGGFLWLLWMKTCRAGLVFGGSQDTHKLLKSQTFSYYDGVHVYTLNGRYSIYKTDPFWRRLIKRSLQVIARKQLSKYGTERFREASASITIQEVLSSEAKLVESRAFNLRFAPTVEYLQWRYNSTLDFVRYRWFDIHSGDDRIGYCILNDAPDQIIIAHSDGTDPELLAYGILKSIFAVSASDSKKRTALLASSHPAMQSVFIRHGLLLDMADRPMVIGSLRSKLTLPTTQQWLVNFGWGDNDLRPATFWRNPKTYVGA